MKTKGRCGEIGHEDIRHTEHESAGREYKDFGETELTNTKKIGTQK